MTKVYKVNIKNDVEFKKFIEKQGYRYLSNSVLKNCFAGENYYWIDGKYYGLLLDTLINQKDVVTKEPVYDICEFKPLNTNNELQSFHFAFQITKLIIFEVKYYRCGNNINKYFSTSAEVFCRNKKDYVQCGQCQLKVLSGLSKTFFYKWDELHLMDLNESQYDDLLNDINDLCNEYNFIRSDNDLSFEKIKELSKLNIKK